MRFPLRLAPAVGRRLHQRSEERRAGGGVGLLGMPEHGHAEGLSGILDGLDAAVVGAARDDQPVPELCDALVVVGVDVVDASPSTPAVIVPASVVTR